jgi:hypothetical protein
LTHKWPLVVPIEHCHAYSCAMSSILILGPPSTLFMFFLRVRAVYHDKKLVVAFFAFLWLSLFGTLFLSPFTLMAGHLGPTKICTVTSVKYYWVISLFIHSAFDTLVFLAISIRIISYAMGRGDLRTRLKSLFVGHGLPRISKCIMQGGQLYYLFVTFIALCCQPLISLPARRLAHVFCSSYFC